MKEPVFVAPVVDRASGEDGGSDGRAGTEAASIEPGDHRPTGDERPGRPPRDRALWIAVVLGAVAALPRLMTVGYFFNLDEWLWMSRSERFSDAILSLTPAQMDATAPIAGTMPGIPTVWLGSLARLVWSAGSVVGLVDPGQSFPDSVSAYTVAQATMALATASLIGLLVWLLCRWISPRVAILAGAVLATEPFWISLGVIVHTDELVALFGLTGLVALAWVLELPSGVDGPRHPRRWAMIAAALLACLILTKVSGVLFAFPALGMVLWALTIAGRGDGRTGAHLATRGNLVRLVGRMVVTVLVVVAVAYPALVLDPARQWDAMVGQFEDVNDDRMIYFLGATTADPGLSYYPVTLAYHSSPWFLLLAPVGVVVALVRAASRRHAALVLAWSVVPALGLLWSSLTYTRYGLVVLGPLTVAAACAVMPSTAVAPRRVTRADRMVVVGAAAMLLAATWTAPWGGNTFNPLLSAYRKPIMVLTVEWGESNVAAIDIIEDDLRARGGTCASAVVIGLGRSPVPSGCVPERTKYRQRAEYAVVPATIQQRWPAASRNLRRNFELVDVGWINDQRVVEVWRRTSDSGLDWPRLSRLIAPG